MNINFCRCTSRLKHLQQSDPSAHTTSPQVLPRTLCLVLSHSPSSLTRAQASRQSQSQVEFSSSSSNLFKMALHLASIFGTEMDKVNCSFYYKIGACRHGDRCSRKHVKPSYSQTILLPNLYQNPAYDPKIKMNASQLQNHFDAFYEDFWCEMCKYGEIEEVVVCDNNNDRKSFRPLHIVFLEFRRLTLIQQI